MNKINKEVMDKLFNNSKVKMIATSDGVAAEGNLFELMSLFTMLTQQLVDGGIPKKHLKMAFELGLDVANDNLKENKKNKKNKEEFIKDLDNFFEEMIKDICDSIGGNDNE